MHTIAIIPARGGSKGIPRKNIIPILGKPLISYTIEVALESKQLNEIWVSSDDSEILDLAKSYNKIRLHVRDESISQDSSPISETILSILSEYQTSEKPESVMLLQPTAPIRDSFHIDAAVNALRACSEMNSLISVCPMDEVHPARMYWKENNELKPILAKYERSHRQKIPLAYYRNGCIYLVRTEAFLEKENQNIKE